MGGDGPDQSMRCVRNCRIFTFKKGSGVLMRCPDSRSIYHFRAGFGGISLARLKS